MSKKEIEMWDIIVKLRTRKGEDGLDSRKEVKAAIDDAICNAQFMVEDLEITVKP